MDKLLYTVPEAAAQLGIGRSKLYELLNSGALPTVRIGRAVRIPASALEAWVARQVEEEAQSHEDLD